MTVSKERKELEELTVWFENLERYDEATWATPMKQGKWSILEVIAHLWLWDEYYLKEFFPYLDDGKELKFNNHETINLQAENYAKTHNQAEIMEGFRYARNRIINGYPNNGGQSILNIGNKEYTFDQFVRTFIIEHDRHHKLQIEAFLKTRIREQSN